jgi:hypothetical protein
VEEEIYVLISAVLRILDNHDLPAREPVASAAEPFAALLASAGPAPGMPSSLSEIRQDNMEALSMVQPLPPKDRAAIFSVEQQSYDSFLRALEEARKPLGTHALDLFQ